MAGEAADVLALIIRSGPYQNRAARADIDLALAAATMDFELHVYFYGAAILQLARERDPAGALLPAGLRAWAALPELADATFYCEQAWLDFCQREQIGLVVPVNGMNPDDVGEDWRRHRHVMVI